MPHTSPLPSKPSSSSSAVWSKLDDYQKTAVGFVLDVKTAALYFEAGTGKTYIAGGVVERLWHPDIRVLLIVPLANYESTWIKFLIDHFDRTRIYTDPETYEDGILLLHYEAVNRYINKLRKIKWDLILYDEAHKLKNRSSLQSRTAAKLRNCAEYKIIMTGTPIESEPIDLWSQFRFCMPNVLGTRWKDFEDYWLEPIEVETTDKDGRPFRRGSLRWRLMLRKLMIAKGQRKFDQSKMPQFLELIEPWTISIKIDDVMTLPSCEVIPTPVTMRGAQRRLYEELEDKAIALFNKGKIKAALKVIKNAKLRQICGGYIKDEDGNLHEVGRAKLRKALEIVNREPKPVVIFCWYLEEVAGLDRELRKLGYAVDYIIGANRKERGKIQSDFQKGLIDVLICQQRTGGVGVDLFRSCRGILYSISHSSIDFDQCIKRLRRRGQTKEVKFWELMVKNTVDEDPHKVINNKIDRNELLINRLKQRGARHGEGSR